MDARAEPPPERPHMPLLPDEAAVDEAVQQERTDTFLLPWLTRVHDLLEEGEVRGSAALVERLLGVCGHASPALPHAWTRMEAGRSARFLVARCLVLLYRTDAPKPPLFEVMGILRDMYAADAPQATQLAALHVSRALVLAYAQHAGSQSSAVPLCLRLVRATGASVLVRYYAWRLIDAVLSTSPSLAPGVLKDALKAAKSGLADKAGPVVRASAACLQVLAKDASRADTEALLATVVKCVHGVDRCTRSALAHLAAALLAHTEAGTLHDEGKEPARVPMWEPHAQLELLHAHLVKAPSSHVRTGILAMYDALLHFHGSAWLEHHLDAVYTHLVRDVAAHLACTPHEHALLYRGVHRILDAHLRALPEPAQERAAAYMGTQLAQWPPPTPTTPPPADTVLALTLDATATLVAQLGELSPTLHDALYDVHMRLLTHPSLSVQLRAAWWLRTACSVQPLLLADTFATLLTYMRRDLDALSKPQHDHGVSLRARLAGHSSALAALASVCAHHPLYMRNDDVEDAFAIAMDLLSRADGAHAAAAIGSAWMLVGALLALGTDFVRAQIPALMHAWRHALAERPYAHLDEHAWQCLLTARHGALSSMHAFFLHGGHELLTPETARRLVVLQSHALAFLDAWEKRHAGDAPAHAPLLRARILRCCTFLAHAPAMDTLAPHLLSTCVEILARAERWHTSSAAQVAISASTGAGSSANTPWSVHDGVAFATTSLLGPHGADIAPWSEAFVTASFRQTRWDSVADGLDADAQAPVLGALEHDPAALYAAPHAPAHPPDVLLGAPAPVPASTAEVDAAAEAFAALFPFHARDLQIGTAEFLAAAPRRPALDKQPSGRRTAVLANSVVALLGACRTAARHRASGFANERVNAAMRSVAQTALQHGHAMLRHAAAELYGYIARLAGSASLSMQVQFLVEQIVDTRHADARAACVLALGDMYARVGGLHAAPLTKTAHSVILSLANDPHPAVHASALDALARVIEAAGVAYEPYVKSTLGMMTRLCAQATHEPEGGSPGSSNLRVHAPAYPGIARVVSALVGVLGPDLHEPSPTRALVYALLVYLAQDGGDAARDAIVGLQRLGLVVPALLETRTWAELLRHALTIPTLAPAATSAYQQMAQRGTAWLSRYGGPALVVTLIHELDAHPLPGLRNLLTAWLRDTAPARPCPWMDVCCTALLTPQALAAKHTHRAQTDADEAASVLATSSDDKPLLLFRWRTQLFLLQCMHSVFACVSTSAEHVGRLSDARDKRVLSSRVAEILRAACSASTATHRAVRKQGLEVLRDVLESFAATPDPEFADAHLLEQFQAPLATALAPAFGADSSPDVLATAIGVCAVYVSAIDTSPQGRIARHLTSALEQTQSSAMTHLGELRVTPNAAAYLNLAVLTAWARLALAKHAAAALVEPHVHTLARAWAHILTAYAVLRADRTAPVASASHVLPRMWPDSALAPLVHTHMLQCFTVAYPTLLHALTLVFETDMDVVRTTLAHDLGDARRACIALYGLALETLCDELDQPTEAEHHMLGVVLTSLHVLVDARYSTNVLLDDRQFDELLCVFQRALLYDDSSVHRGVLRVVRAMVCSMRERLLENEDGVADDAMPSSRLGRLWSLVAHFIDALPAQRTPRSERAALLHAAWHILVDMLGVCGGSLQTELVAVALHMLVAYARREDEASALLTPALPIVRDVCAQASRAATENPAMTHRAIQGFLSAMIEMGEALRARSGEIVTRRSGNALVAASLVLTSLDGVTVSSEAIERLASLLTHKLDADDDAAVAVQCLRSMAQGTPTHAVHLCLGACIPSLVAHSLRTTSAPAMDALLALVHTMPANAALAIALPIAVTFLHRGATQHVPTLLSLARHHADAFRTATQALDDAARSALQDTFRSALGVDASPQKANAAASHGEASISLRTFGT